jgi:hypothetical protein
MLARCCGTRRCRCNAATSMSSTADTPCRGTAVPSNLPMPLYTCSHAAAQPGRASSPGCPPPEDVEALLRHDGHQLAVLAPVHVLGGHVDAAHQAAVRPVVEAHKLGRARAHQCAPVQPLRRVVQLDSGLLLWGAGTPGAGSAWRCAGCAGCAGYAACASLAQVHTGTGTVPVSFQVAPQAACDHSRAPASCTQQHQQLLHSGQPPALCATRCSPRHPPQSS